MSTFINPFTDFGFKKLFGQELALPRLKSFIEDALELARPIRNLCFLTPNSLPLRTMNEKPFMTSTAPPMTALMDSGLSEDVA